MAIQAIKLPLVKKKDGRYAEFQPEKILNAAKKALIQVGCVEDEAAIVAGKVTESTVYNICGMKVDKIDYNDIHDLVELGLMDHNKHAAKAYVLYRFNHKRENACKDILMSAVKTISVETSKENANMANSPSTKFAQIGSAANKTYVLRHLLPPHIAKAHEDGDIHVHDLDFYQLTYNCLTYDLAKILEGGFNMPHGKIREPKSFYTACALTAITLQSVQNDQYGGVGIDRIDTALKKYAKKATDREIFQGCEAFIFNMNSLHSRSGNQIPFSSISLGVDTDPDARRVAKGILDAYDAGLGDGEMALFPNILFKVKEGINLNPGDPNHDLLLRALEVTSHRMNPTYVFLDSSFNSPYGLEATAMGCRTRVIANRVGPELTAGRGNIAFVTANLPRIAIKNRDVNDFFNGLQGILELCEEQLVHRWNVVKNLKVKDVPFVFGQGIYMGSEGLGPDDNIESALKNGTLSIGFIGLAETLKLLTGKTHAESDEAQELGLKIIKYIRDFCNSLCEKYNLNFSLIGTPAEGLSDRFTKMDKKRFGVIEGVTDHDIYTNSNHVPVYTDVSVTKKLDIELPYHKYCNAGHITYVELGAPPTNNVAGLYEIIKYMKEHDAGYCGFNFPHDFCNKCYYQGTVGEACPVCGECVDIRRTRRLTGYFSSEDRIGAGKESEIKQRVSHTGRVVVGN